MCQNGDMRKFAVSVCLLLSASACGGDSDSGAVNATTEVPTTTTMTEPTREDLEVVSYIETKVLN